MQGVSGLRGEAGPQGIVGPQGRLAPQVHKGYWVSEASQGHKATMAPMARREEQVPQGSAVPSCSCKQAQLAEASQRQ